MNGAPDFTRFDPNKVDPYIDQAVMFHGQRGTFRNVNGTPTWTPGYGADFGNGIEDVTSLIAPSGGPGPQMPPAGGNGFPAAPGPGPGQGGPQSPPGGPGAGPGAGPGQGPGQAPGQGAPQPSPGGGTPQTPPGGAPIVPAAGGPSQPPPLTKVAPGVPEAVPVVVHS